MMSPSISIRTMWMSTFFCVNFMQLLIDVVITAEDQFFVWHWICVNGKCNKIRYDPLVLAPPHSLEECKMFCNDYGLLWPRPTGDTNLGSVLTEISLNDIDVKILNTGPTDDLMNAVIQRFKLMVSSVLPKGVEPKSSGKSVDVYIVNENPAVKEFSLALNESYSVKTFSSSHRLEATITGNNFFGVRHGLETLTQLILYDDLRDLLLMATDVSITDKPKYPYRGVLLDTARNYFTVDSIKATIDAMAAVKLNTFHWHITDVQSFPFVSQKRPNLTLLGAYSPSKVYTKRAIRDIVRYGLERGVRVVPELDAPAHVGEGWQRTNLTLCFKAEPWGDYCGSPPCGQLNPIRAEVYEYLEDIYTEMAEAFEPDLFHMGGDEVSKACWYASREVRDFLKRQALDTADESTFFKLWSYFQRKAQKKVYKAFEKTVPLIIWSSGLTDYHHIAKYLRKEDYIIQMWTVGADSQIKGLLQEGYQLILSNHDVLYFDCGFASWIGSADNNWCGPYIGWKKVYNDTQAFVKGNFKGQILGGEATIWSETTDSASLDSRLWPRAAALAERLWSDPDTGWELAQSRMLHTRERLVRMGIRAEPVQPEWCYQNDGYCTQSTAHYNSPLVYSIPFFANVIVLVAFCHLLYC